MSSLDHRMNHTSTSEKQIKTFHIDIENVKHRSVTFKIECGQTVCFAHFNFFFFKLISTFSSIAFALFIKYHARKQKHIKIFRGKRYPTITHQPPSSNDRKHPHVISIRFSHNRHSLWHRTSWLLQNLCHYVSPMDSITTKE